MIVTAVRGSIVGVDLSRRPARCIESELLQPLQYPLHQARALVDQAGVDLDQGGSGLQLGPGIVGTHDASHGDDRQRPPGALMDQAHYLGAALGEGGATIEALEQKFSSAMTAMGMDADVMLAAWQKASNGMLSSAEIMRKANYLVLIGIPVSELEWMFQAASNAAQATGQSMEFLFSKLAMGLARKSKLMLDDLGIIVGVMVVIIID